MTVAAGAPSECGAPQLLAGSELDAHVARAWDHFKALGSPKFHVAPMVDQVRGSASRQPHGRRCASWVPGR